MSSDSQKYQLAATAREKLRTDSFNTYQNLGRIVAHAKLLETLLSSHCTAKADTSTAGRTKSPARNAGEKLRERTETTQRDQENFSSDVVAEDTLSPALTRPSAPRRSLSYASEDSDSDSDLDSDSDSDYDSEDDGESALDDYEHFVSNFNKILAALRSANDPAKTGEGKELDAFEGQQGFDVTVTEVAAVE